MVQVVNSKFLESHIGTRCPYCHVTMTESGKRVPTRDHFLPKSKGHGLGNNNRVICCAKCNTSKGSKHPIAWWFGLKHGNDPRAAIIFEFIVRRHDNGQLSLSKGIKVKHLEAYRQHLTGWEKPLINFAAPLINVVARLGTDEIYCSLSATWN